MSTLGWLILAAFWIALGSLVGSFARTHFYRWSFGWFMLSLLFSPPVAFLFLLAAGIPIDAAPRIKFDPAEAEPREGQTQEQASRICLHLLRPDTLCPVCRNIVNAQTGRGMAEDEKEPWRTRCSKCGTELDFRAHI